MKRISPIKVLVVDDSPLIRSTLSRVLSEEPDIDVIGGAKDAIEARQLIIAYRPNLIILDIEMPRMDGLTFLARLREHYPVPVIMCSGQGPSSSAAALRAIELGAVDVVAKPRAGGSEALRQFAENLVRQVRDTAEARPTPPIPPSANKAPSRFAETGLDPDRYLIAIGASTGGTEAIRRVLVNVAADFPPVLMVQHMPEGFTRSFALRLDQLSPMEVREAEDGDLLTPGKALLARGGTQMRVQAARHRWRVTLDSTESVNGHCPSVDVLFDSIARCRGRQAVGVLLTGMGADGARGLLHMRREDAVTIAQDRASSVVYGMPKVAVDLGAVQYQCAPTDVGHVIVQALQSRARHAGDRHDRTEGSGCLTKGGA